LETIANLLLSNLLYEIATAMTRQNYNFTWLYDIGQLLFPIICRSCGRPLQDDSDIICIACHYKLPRTHYHQYKMNPVYQKFWGRIPVQEAFSFLHFRKGNVTQTLLHALKYKGRQDVGERLGYLLGSELTQAGYTGPDVIIPLPLHDAKLRVRGYNQCDSIARGLQRATGIPANGDLVKRIIANATQTEKSRFDRWLNVDKIFVANKAEAIRGRHVLLIDDVVTTGSTLEACGHCLINAGAKAVSIATIASA
jgi:ComF family protein